MKRSKSRGTGPVIRQFEQTLLVHPLTPAGPIPTICDPDGVYPYPSYAETSRRPVLKRHRFVSIENPFLRVTICPDLGGKVHSICELQSGKEILFVPESVHPIRILPRFGFIPGGIEVSFPISHSPVQCEKVAFECRRLGDRAYVWCGEREAHFGLQWTVEYSLGGTDRFLTQRTQFRNPTARAHPWMSWSNAALPARPDTEFHFPDGPVLRHAHDLTNISWRKDGRRRVRDVAHMAGFFWLAPEGAAFGAFTPSLGHGLYHIADLNSVPGMKLWTYGIGRDEPWGRCASINGETYIEIQAGPIRDQSIKQWLEPGQTRAHTEFWVPSTVPLDIKSLELPAPNLVSLSKVPWFDWPPRADLQFWLKLLDAHKRGARTELPDPPGIEENWWAPSGMEALGGALAWAVLKRRGHGRDAWLFQLGAWLAGRDEIDQALRTLALSRDDRAHALAARLFFRARTNPRRARAAFKRITDRSIACHPQVVIERDLTLAALGSKTLAEREKWLSQLGNSEDEWVRERRAALLLDQGKALEARALLTQTAFQSVHQRYVRTELWNRTKELLKDSEAAPDLGEDELARFGAYREFDQ